MSAPEKDLLRSLLLVDDDAVFRPRLAQAFRKRGWEVFEASGVGEARAISESPEFAVVDLRMPDGSGLEVVRHLHALDASTRIVVLTGWGSIATALDALRAGALDYLQKPADADQIEAALLGKKPSDAATEPEDDLHGVPSLARVEWEHIQRVLVACDHNVSQAAKALGLHRRSLQRKLGKYPAAR
jgi:two-component system response regulator RegA